MIRLILPFLLIVVILFAISTEARADDIYSTQDTMRLFDNYGQPGDTVDVILHIANLTAASGGYSGRILFDNAVLRPLRVTAFERGAIFDATAGDTTRPGELLFLAYTFTPGAFMPRGAGPVAKIRFIVRPSATPGSITVLRFVDDTEPPINGVNAFSDSLGRNLIHPQLANGNFSVTGGGLNQPPVISNIGPQQVAEGQVLQFPVTAHDPNGDPITLSASNLPENSSFPTTQGDSVVTGVFTFTPNFQQGPDTYYVSFVAADDHNNTNNLLVQIIVLDQPNDRLTVDSNQGGVPGATARALEVNLFNSRHIYGLQFDYYYDESQLTVVDVVPTERCVGLGFWHSFPEPGKIKVLIFSPGLDPINIGTGPIVRFITDVNVDGVFGRKPVTLDSAIEVIDSLGTSRPLITENGYFTVDRFGDANLDEVVNVGDCVTLVAFIIERIDLNIRQFDAADINRDGRVNVGDMQQIINMILQLPVTPPGPIGSWPMVLVELLRNQTPAGGIIEFPLWAEIATEAAAVQFELNFNPDRLEPLGIEAGDMVSGLRLDSHNSPGKINGVFYDFGGSTFGPATGEMVNFAFRLKTGELSPRDISISEFIIVDPAAGYIPSEIKGQLPEDYALAQNYPNPFNANTNISFDLPYDDNVELLVYDLLGRRVATLVSDFLPAGNHTVNWDGRAETGETLATGVFFYRLKTSEFDATKKMLLIK